LAVALLLSLVVTPTVYAMLRREGAATINSHTGE
jgi:hypothetical protein